MKFFSIFSPKKISAKYSIYACHYVNNSRFFSLFTLNYSDLSRTRAVLKISEFRSRTRISVTRKASDSHLKENLNTKVFYVKICNNIIEFYDRGLLL